MSSTKISISRSVNTQFAIFPTMKINNPGKLFSHPLASLLIAFVVVIAFGVVVAGVHALKQGVIILSEINWR